MEWAKARDVAECPVPMTWVGGEESIEFVQKMHGKLAHWNAVAGSLDMWSVAIGAYLRWRNRHAQPKRHFAIPSKIRQRPVPGNLDDVA